MLKTVEKIEEKVQSISQEKIDVTSFNYYDLTRKMMMSVNDQLIINPASTPRSVIQDITNLAQNQKTTDEEARDIISAILSNLDDHSFDDSVRKYIFEPSIVPEKERLRHVTKGNTNFSILSKEIEERVFSLYKTIFKYQLEHHFQLLTSEEFFLSSLPFIVELYHIKELRFNKQRPEQLFDFFSIDMNSCSEEERKQAEEILRKGFENSERNFAFPQSITQLKKIKNYFYLYSEQDKQKLLELYTPIIENHVQTFIEDLNEKEKSGLPIGFSDSYIANQLTTLKQNITYLQLLEK